MHSSMRQAYYLLTARSFYDNMHTTEYAYNAYSSSTRGYYSREYHTTRTVLILLILSSKLRESSMMLLPGGSRLLTPLE